MFDYNTERKACRLFLIILRFKVKKKYCFPFQIIFLLEKDEETEVLKR